MAANPLLSDALINLGLESGDTVLAIKGEDVSESLGDPDEIVSEIIRILGPMGTIVVPGFGFHPSQGAISIPPFAEALLHVPGASLSDHPTHPIAAVGRLASIVTENHGSNSAFGRNTPLFKLFQAGAKVLQVGCDFSENPMVFVAEEMACLPYISRARPMSFTLSSGKTVTRWIRQPGCHRGFGSLADPLRECESYSETAVGDTPLRLMDARSVVNAARDAVSMGADALLCLEPDCELCAEARAIIDANAADESDKRVIEQAEEDERMTRDLERRLDGGLAKFVDSSDAGFSSN